MAERTMVDFPEAWETEDGGWWGPGHSDPAAFVLSCILGLGKQVSHYDALEFIENHGPEVARNVEHVWMRAHPDDADADPEDARWEKCGMHDEGAEPFTVLGFGGQSEVTDHG